MHSKANLSSYYLDRTISCYNATYNTLRDDVPELKVITEQKTEG